MTSKTITERRIGIAVTKLYGGGNIHAVTRNGVAKQLGVYPQALEKFLVAETGTNFYEWIKEKFIDQLNDPTTQNSSLVANDTELAVLCGKDIALEKGLLGVTQSAVALQSKILQQRINYIIGSNDKLRSLVWGQIYFETKDKIKNRKYWEPDIEVARVLVTGFAIGIRPAVAALNADTDTEIGKRILLASVDAIYFSTAIIVSE